MTIVMVRVSLEQALESQSELDVIEQTDQFVKTPAKGQNPKQVLTQIFIYLLSNSVELIN